MRRIRDSDATIGGGATATGTVGRWRRSRSARCTSRCTQLDPMYLEVYLEGSAEPRSQRLHAQCGRRLECAASGGAARRRAHAHRQRDCQVAAGATNGEHDRGRVSKSKSSHAWGVPRNCESAVDSGMSHFSSVQLFHGLTPRAHPSCLHRLRAQSCCAGRGRGARGRGWPASRTGVPLRTAPAAAPFNS